ncbi:MAG: adenosylmethionine--8-amino-7-oxononanoate transaminase [Pseudomonadota bacterium]|nr:adenosylmethionine--8-amino-7-oxononanoate transaminase [Pseudomonadota bacterium]
MSSKHKNIINKIVKRDLKTLWHPCTQMKDHENIPLIPIKRGKGVWIEDYSGEKYIDAISSWWVNLFGHCNSYINKKVRVQLEELEHVLLAGFTHMPAIELSERLIKLAPKEIKKCFFADNGSSAIDAAMKMSFHYWKNKGYSKKNKFIALSNSYHGETLGALSISNIDLYKKTYKGILKNTILVKSPDCFYKNEKESDKNYTKKMFDEMLKKIKSNHKEVCSVIVEPLVQCAGYMRMYHPVYLSLLRETCSKYNVHLIVDEIAVGFGRTGTMFAFEQSKIVPDIICLSKGITGGYMALSSILTTEEVYEAFYDEYIKLNAFLHSHSYTANPIACTAACASLDLFKKYNTLKNNRILSNYIQNKMTHLLDHPNVAEIRQKGMIIAVEIVKDKRRRTPYDWKERRGMRAYLYGLKNNVLIRPLGNVIYFMPPYVITFKEIDKVIDVITGAIHEATK